VFVEAGGPADQRHQAIVARQIEQTIDVRVRQPLRNSAQDVLPSQLRADLIAPGASWRQLVGGQRGQPAPATGCRQSSALSSCNRCRHRSSVSPTRGVADRDTRSRVVRAIGPSGSTCAGARIRQPFERPIVA
jgi:hypothetical protein